MAQYSQSLYGESFFGDVAPSLFRADAFTATPLGYGDVTVRWSTPGGDWQRIRLLRNPNGYPADEVNGNILLETQAGADTQQYIDRGLLADRWMYYSLFVFNAANGIWLRSGDVRVYVPKDYSGGQRMYELLPRRVKPGEYDTSLTIDPITQRSRTVNPLAGLMSIFGYQYDVLRNLLNSTLDLYDSGSVCYDLVPILLRQFNIDPEPEIGPEQYRRLLRNIVRLYQTKGTSTGIHALVAALTGWDSYVRPGTNLMWDAEHSDFVGGIGYWSAGAINCAPVWDAATSAMRLVASADGDASTSLVTKDNVAYLGIIVLPAVDYNVSATIAAVDTSHAPANVEIDWYDKDYNPISTAVGTGVPTTQGDVRISVVGTAPAGAVYLGVTVAISGATAGASWLVKHVQVNRNAALQPSEPGRDVHILLRSQRKNVVGNGSFGGGTAGWVHSSDIELAVDPTFAFVGEQSGKLTYTGAGVSPSTPAPLPFAALEFDTTPGLRYVVQVRTAANPTGVSTTVNIAARDDTANVGDSNERGAYDTIVMTGPAWVEHAFPFIADATKTSFVVYLTDAATGDEVWVDAMMAEAQAEGSDADVRNLAAVQPYFDGSTGSVTNDYLWEGDSFNSPSHYYDRRTIHEARLRAMLPKFLPLGATYTLLWAQPDEEYYAVPDVLLVESAPVVPTTPVSKTLTGRWRDDILVSVPLRAEWDIEA
jgi:hypothetical protein